MVTSLRRSGGFTLIEVVIAMMLLPIVFLAATTVYATATQFFLKAKNNSGRIDALIAAETIARKVAMANMVTIDGTGQIISMRWDYAANTFSPRSSPKDFTDDSWVKYAVIAGKLYWRNDAVGADPDDPGTAVTASDTEWAPGLTITSTPTFTKVNPSLAWDAANAGDPTMVYIELGTSSGNPVQTLTVKTESLIGARGKN